jgi:nitrogen fixation/metabolism regulation signal transduction histidine kinase
MEITYFVLGMLTIVALVILTAVVVGMVKINKLEKSIKQLHELCRAIDGDLRHLISDTNREITMVEKTIMQRIDKEIEGAHRHIQHEFEEIQKHEHELETVLHRDIDETRRYIDSRIDKVVASGSLTSAKRQING